MRFILIIFIFFSYVHIAIANEKQNDDNLLAIIVEVDGNVSHYEKHIKTYFPAIDVMATYTELFQGLAIKGPVEKVNKFMKSSFIKSVYPVHTYTKLRHNYMSFHSFTKRDDAYLPNTLNKTSFTGKGVKVAVIDTGIDYSHPDLQNNFVGGKDVVDYDNDPMETTEEEGIPTNHGTHVTGIIGANGTLQGVAPDVDIYAYRALGPGGFGTTVQVLAALEEAVKDRVDIINLSLGNSVNGPDYPTSVAVNEAAKRGVAVIIANGNSGPDNWTVGAPATATRALSVGAYAEERQIPYLLHNETYKKIYLQQLPFAKKWKLRNNYEVTTRLRESTGKIVLLSVDEQIEKKIKKAEQLHAEAILLYEIDEDSLNSLLQQNDKVYDIPIAFISEEDSQLLKEKTPTSVKSNVQLQKPHVAPFSSRGPVTVNWQLKPDIIAPGVAILSTVPGGYDILNGTSMAAPHVTGAVALVKEAHPEWTNEQIFGAIKTTARLLEDNGDVVSPIEQGAGIIQIDKAIETETIIYNPLLSFGKMNDHINVRTINVTIENKSNEDTNFSFDIPKKQIGYMWDLPQSFTIKKRTKQTVPVTVKINSRQLDKGIHEGFLTLNRLTDGEKMLLPYMFINETANYRQVMGFTFHLNLLNDNNYTYQFYAPEQLQSLRVHLFERDTLLAKGELLHLEDLHIGLNEGIIARNEIRDEIEEGHYYALIVTQLSTGQFVTYETDLFLY